MGNIAGVKFRECSRTVEVSSTRRYYFTSSSTDSHIQYVGTVAHLRPKAY